MLPGTDLTPGPWYSDRLQLLYDDERAGLEDQDVISSYHMTYLIPMDSDRRPHIPESFDFLDEIFKYRDNVARLATFPDLSEPGAILYIMTEIKNCCLLILSKPSALSRIMAGRTSDVQIPAKVHSLISLLGRALNLGDPQGLNLHSAVDELAQIMRTNPRRLIQVHPPNDHQYERAYLRILLALNLVRLEPSIPPSGPYHYMIMFHILKLIVRYLDVDRILRLKSFYDIPNLELTFRWIQQLASHKVPGVSVHWVPLPIDPSDPMPWPQFDYFRASESGW